MRALLPAAGLLLLAAGAASAQPQPPPVSVLPEQGAPPTSSAPPVPPPTVLLPPSPSDTGPASSEEAAPAPVAPVKRPRRTAAIVQALDKTTAETMRFEVPVGQPVRYKDLVFTVHVCEDSAPELGQRGAAAHLEIDSSPAPMPGRATSPTRQVFRGWMFANAPGLHPFEHPVYDAWLIGCKASSLPTPAPAPPPAPAE